MALFNIYISETRGENNYHEKLIGTALVSTKAEMNQWCEKQNTTRFPDGERTVFHRLINVESLEDIEKKIL